MKKIFALILALAMFVSLAACAAPAAEPAPAAEETAPAAEAAPADEAPASESAATSAGKDYKLIFATGGTSGTYYPYGGAVAQVINKQHPNISINVQATGASAENINLINSGDADLAIVQNDVMDYAYNGTESFDGNQIQGFSTMCTVYSEVCQVIANPSSGIKSIADLKGKRVSVGDIGSGVESNARQILGAYGITFDDIQSEHLGFGPSADAMKDNKLDAFFVTAGVPTTAIMELATTNDIQIVPIDGAEADKLIEEHPFYTKFTIPGGTYKGVDEDAVTLAVKATIIVRPELDEAVVYDMTKAIFENIEAITTAHAKGVELDVNAAVQGVSVPFHPGAEKYFKEAGVL